jgi:hypothetical protein
MRSGNGLWSIRAGMSVRPMFAAARSPLKGFGSRSKSGSLDMLTAIRRASSRVSRLLTARRCGSSSKYERLPVRIADDEAFGKLIHGAVENGARSLATFCVGGRPERHYRGHGSLCAVGMGNVNAKGRVPVSHWETNDGTLLTCDLMTRAAGQRRSVVSHSARRTGAPGTDSVAGSATRRREHAVERSASRLAGPMGHSIARDRPECFDA